MLKSLANTIKAALELLLFFRRNRSILSIIIAACGGATWIVFADSFGADSKPYFAYFVAFMVLWAAIEFIVQGIVSAISYIRK